MMVQIWWLGLGSTTSTTVSLLRRFSFLFWIGMAIGQFGGAAEYAKHVVQARMEWMVRTLAVVVVTLALAEASTWNGPVMGGFQFRRSDGRCAPVDGCSFFIYSCVGGSFLSS